MGFGFSLFFAFFLLPLTGILLICWAVTKKSVFGKALKFIWGAIVGLIFLSSIIQFFKTKKRVQKEDIYGEYIIDRSKFSGHQADWQYENFKFEITHKEELIFYQLNEGRITKSDTAKVEFLTQYINDRIRIEWNPNMHHIIEEEPTLYRDIWSFYYVFKSPKFGNVFFIKGKWEPIQKR